MGPNRPHGRSARAKQTPGSGDFKRFLVRAVGLVLLTAALVWAGWKSPWARRDTAVRLEAADAPRSAGAGARIRPAEAVPTSTPRTRPGPPEDDPRPADIYGVGDGPQGSRPRVVDEPPAADAGGAGRPSQEPAPR